MKKIHFLDTADLNIRVRKLDYVKNVHYNNYHYYCVKSGNTYGSIKLLGDEYFQSFIELGKEIYNIDNKCINKINFRETIKVYKIDSLFLNKDILRNDAIRKALEKYFEKSPVYITETLNRESKEAWDEEIEIYTLTDMAVFCFLVITSLNNYYLKKDDPKEYEEGNKIEFNNFTEIENDKLFDFLARISELINFYERNVYCNNRPLLRETTGLTFNERSKKMDFERVYDNIYSLYWVLFKAQIASMVNGNYLYRPCRCGTIIIDKSKHCGSCKKTLDRDRKTKKANSNN